MEFSEDIIVLIGLMGSGKSRVGFELSKLLKLPFVDSDKEIEKAAQMPIPDIFETLGEQEFRKGEKKVMLRLLSGEPKVLASGGGAFIQPEIRAAVKEHAVSIWLKASLETLVERTARNNNRPLLQGVDRSEKLQQLIDARYPIYAEADITVVTDNQSPRHMARIIIEHLQKWKEEHA
ncbi:MAG TPA: shikimate kinase [Patescibacteria group bacterium]|nr:shikimate kinase [Patescibacteria group bacterium]